MKSATYVHEVFKLALRRMMPYNFVENGLDMNYGRVRKPPGQLVPLQSVVVSLLT